MAEVKVLFVEGGPLDGQLRDLPDGTQIWEVMEPATANLVAAMSDITPTTALGRRGRYLRYVGLEQRSWRRNLVTIGVPFVWQGWDRSA